MAALSSAFIKMGGTYMRRLQSTGLFVVFPIAGNIILALAAFVFNPAEFRANVVVVAWAVGLVMHSASSSDAPCITPRSGGQSKGGN